MQPLLGRVSEPMFAMQVERHYSLNSSNTELTIEKLQLIVTARATAAAKIQWLEYFNSSAATREARKIPPKPVNEEKLTLWLHKATFWAEVLFSQNYLVVVDALWLRNL